MHAEPYAVSAADAIDVDLVPLPPIDALERTWTDLERRADGSFFLSWLWVGNWLRHLPPGTRAHLLTARRGGRVVGLAVLCRRARWRFGLLPQRHWLLHETGDRVFDRLFVEYNGVLADGTCAEAVADACFAWLASRVARHDELVLGGLDAANERAVRRAAAAGGYALDVRTADCAQWVDLDLVRRQGGDYLATLGRSTRSAVKRTLRLYADRGPLEYRVASTVEEALADFDALEVLHQARWKARGESGAFDNPAFRPFHERLIRTGVPDGSVRLCRITAAGEPIGFLYNFVSRGRVLNYQGGFAFESDNRLKPGLVSHVLAIEDSLARGERCYDFMSTAAGHKPLLSNAEQPMNWFALGRDGVHRAVDAHLRQMRARAARAWRRLRRGGPARAET
ncbi:MAG TPA: GNAT family N-acetyltransferase [Azospirillum sp.]|nr:GNAT family N-acetyltransferase [Azospirillum sp.]